MPKGVADALAAAAMTEAPGVAAAAALPLSPRQTDVRRRLQAVAGATTLTLRGSQVNGRHRYKLC